MTDDSRGQRRERPIWSAACFTAFTVEGKRGGKARGMISHSPVQHRLFTRFIISKFVTNFLWGAARKEVKETFSVWCFPVGKAGPAVGDDGLFPLRNTDSRGENLYFHSLAGGTVTFGPCFYPPVIIRPLLGLKKFSNHQPRLDSPAFTAPPGSGRAGPLLRSSAGHTCLNLQPRVSVSSG